MSIFNNVCRWGPAKWDETSRRPLNSQELNAIDHASVVALQYGYGVCFFLKNGEDRTIPLSVSSNLKPGQNIDPSKLEVVKLDKEGEEFSLYRVIEL